MSSNGTANTSSPLYRYAVLAAVFLFASVFLTVYVRSRIESRRRHLTLGGAHGIPDFDPLKKPPLFDAYLSEPPHIPDPAAAREWDEIMPLSASNVGAPHSSPAQKGGSPVAAAAAQPAESDPTRLLVGLIVRMPLPSVVPGGSSAEEEPPLPYLEIGLSEVDVLHARDRRPTKTVP
ncbi:hypothetical protein FB451DRAFT_72166 [Mycena latifolia]|nr:hypothetical protein FB451DRAFT_72166 [Mycena latifolia]